MKFILSCMLLLVAGCGTQFVVRPHETDTVVVTWLATDSVDRECRARGNRSPDLILGCASFVPGYCVILTGKNTTYDILGHELRHCFEGNFHP